MLLLLRESHAGLAQAAEVATAEAGGVSCEIIDLRTLLPWDRDTIGEQARDFLSDTCAGLVPDV